VFAQLCSKSLHNTCAQGFPESFNHQAVSCAFLACPSDGGPSDGANGDKGNDGSLSWRDIGVPPRDHLGTCVSCRTAERRRILGEGDDSGIQVVSYPLLFAASSSSTDTVRPSALPQVIVHTFSSYSLLVSPQGFAGMVAGGHGVLPCAHSVTACSGPRNPA
jgi:hypothetical protein